MPGTVLGTWDTSMQKHMQILAPMKPYLGARVALGSARQYTHTHTHREVKNMLEGDKCFGKIIDQSTVDQDSVYEDQVSILNRVMLVVGLPEKKVTLEIVDTHWLHEYLGEDGSLQKEQLMERP